MDDSDDEEETMQVDKPKSSVASELENYLDCRDVAADPLEFWENFDERERKSAEDFRLQSGAFREREKLRAAHHWTVRGLRRGPARSN